MRKQEKQVIEFIKRDWIVPLMAIKSLFNAAIQVVWGLVSLGL